MSEAMRRRLALTAFQHTAAYDAAISRWLAARLEGAAGDGDAGHAGADDEGAAGAGDAGHADGGAPARARFPGPVAIHIPRFRICATAKTRTSKRLFTGLDKARACGFRLAGAGSWAASTFLQQHQRRRRALRLVMEFDVPATVAVKHTNPCGVGMVPDPATAFERAFRADDVSIFGGIVAFNRRVDGATARLLSLDFSRSRHRPRL